MVRKNLLVAILSLALLSLACLQSAVVSDESSDRLAVISDQTESVDAAFGEPTEDYVFTLIPSPSPEGRRELCAVVVAEVALHVRQSPSETGLVLDWLVRGDAVHVVDQSDGDWWFIEREGVSGYVRAAFLEEQECE